MVPLAGALAIWLTYLLGLRVFRARRRLPLAAAVPSRPARSSSYQLMNPMTDVPVTAAIALAQLLVISGWPVAAGLAAGVAILVPGAESPGCRVRADRLGWQMTRGRPLRFALAVAPAIVIVA